MKEGLIDVFVQLLRRVFRRDRAAKTAARVGLDFNLHRPRFDGLHEVVEHSVYEVLVPDAHVPIPHQVILQRSQLDAFLAGGVGDAHLGEIGQTRERADAREFVGRRDNSDIFANGLAGIFILEALQAACVDGLRAFEWTRLILRAKLLFTSGLIVHSKCTSLYRSPRRQPRAIPAYRPRQHSRSTG